MCLVKRPCLPCTAHTPWQAGCAPLSEPLQPLPQRHACLRWSAYVTPPTLLLGRTAAGMRRRAGQKPKVAAPLIPSSSRLAAQHILSPCPAAQPAGNSAPLKVTSLSPCPATQPAGGPATHVTCLSAQPGGGQYPTLPCPAAQPARPLAVDGGHPVTMSSCPAGWCSSTPWRPWPIPLTGSTTRPQSRAARRRCAPLRAPSPASS